MLSKEPYQVIGNKEARQLLDFYVERAKRGLTDCICIVEISESIDLSCNYAGSNASHCMAYIGLDILKAKLLDQVRGITPPPARLDTPANLWTYNFARGPAGFDFMGWLVNAEMTRVREGAPAPLRVHFHLGNDPHKAFYPPIRKQMLENVMRPLVGMIGGVEDLEPNEGRTNHSYSFAPIIEAYERGEEVPKLFTPVPKPKFKIPPIVITLRECGVPHRNSNLPEWIRFAEWLKKEGELVIFVRDTDKAEEPIEGFETWPDASIDLRARLGLYQAAKCNLFVANGPAGLAYFTDRPWLIWQKISDDDPFYFNTLEGFRAAQGIDAGGQMPWASEQQRFVWEADTFESMCRAWNELGV